MFNLMIVIFTILFINSFAKEIQYDIPSTDTRMSVSLRGLKLMENQHNSSLILPYDDGKTNWGDKIEVCAVSDGTDRLLFTNLYINPVESLQRMYKFEKTICADKIITEVRFLNLGRHRGMVCNVKIHRHKLSEDLIEAIFIANPKEQFRILVEVYGYDISSSHKLLCYNKIILLIMVYSFMKLI